MNKASKMAEKMNKRNPLVKRPGIAAVDVLQDQPPTEVKVEQATPQAPKKEDQDGRTDSLFLKVTKKEKRLLKIHAIEGGVFIQDVASAAFKEYFENHPLSE